MTIVGTSSEYESKFEADVVWTVQVQRVGILQVGPDGLQALNLFFDFVVRGHAVVLVETAYGGCLRYDEAVGARVECRRGPGKVRGDDASTSPKGHNFTALLRSVLLRQKQKPNEIPCTKSSADQMENLPVLPMFWLSYQLHLRDLVSSL